MSDLISREDVDKAIRSICDLCGEDKKNNGVMCGACNLDSFIRAFDDIPSAEPERTAKVMRKQETHIVTPPKSTTIAYETETNLWTECGNCGAMGMYHGWKYCPMCGVKLDWGE